MGLDLSITGTGVVVYEGEASLVFGNVLCERHPKTAPFDRPTRESGLAANGTFYGTDMERIDFILRKVKRAWRTYQPIIVGIEAYAFGARGRGLSILHELGGVVKWWLHKQEALVVTYSPSDIKKFATGKGTANKEEMVAAAWGFGFKNTHDDNSCDAFHIARKALYEHITSA